MHDPQPYTSIAFCVVESTYMVVYGDMYGEFT